jgi:iron complex outermembrane receptor protein
LQGGGLGGAVQLNSLPDWGNRFHASYLQGIGSFSTFDEMLHLSFGNRKWQSKTKLYNNFSKNDYPFVNKSLPEKPLVRNENAEFGKMGFLQEFYFRANGHALFSLKAWGQSASRSLPAVMSFEGDEQSNLNRQNDRTLKVVADYLHYAGDIKYYFRTGVDRQELLYRLENRVSGVGVVPAIYSESAMQSWYNHAKVEWKPTERFALHLLSDGNHYGVVTNDTVPKVGYEADRSDFAFAGAFYLQPARWVNLSVLGRKEKNGADWSPFIFYVGAGFKPFRLDRFVIDASFSSNHHHPSLNDLYWQPGGNPDLKSEVGLSGELTLKHMIEKRMLTIEQSLTGYRSAVDDWIIWLPGFKGYWEPFNVKKVDSYGGEYQLKAETQLGNVRFNLLCNYALYPFSEPDWNG